MRYLSLFSGIEAASVAWHPLGWTPVAFAEVDKFPAAVLAERFPGVANWGDVTKFKEWPDATFDVLVGGSPCQSFSVAGLRKGLADPRGNLMLTYLAIAGRYRPRWLLWENVPGVLSADQGRAFATFLGALAELGYGFAYRVLDAQFFGVPQRRRRVFVVGHLGDWRRAAAVLFERQSLSGDPAPRRAQGEGIAPSLAARTRGGGGLGLPAVANPLTALMHKGINTTCDEGQTLVTTLAIRGRGDSYDLEIRNDGQANALLTPSGGRGGIGVGAIAIQERASAERVDSGPGGLGVRTDNTAYTLEARSVPQAVADLRNVTSRANRSNPQPGDPHHTLHDPNQSVIAFNGRQDPIPGPIDTDPMSSAVAVAPTLDQRAGRSGENSFATSGGLISSAMHVRRITPREAERLQGFPDDWTAIQYRGKAAADGPRYKALGNSMAVPVIRWIGERIAAVDNMRRKAEC